MIVNAAGPTAIADSYIVVLRDTSALRASVVPALARQLAGRHDGAVSRTYQSALQGFSVRLSEANARRLAAEPAVAFIEQDPTVTISGTQTNPPSWGLDRIDQRDLPVDRSYTYPTTASNVRAYIIDTGIRTTHTDFGGRAVSGRDTVENDNDATDCNGHGTHGAGTVGGGAYGVAKGVQLVGVRVLDCAGSGSNAGVIAGVDWVTANAVKPAVANMSLGGGVSTALDTSVRNSINSGITYALAAGNENTSACNSSPSRVAEAITVGATGSNDARASFSNYGTCVDIFAPGVDITSAWSTSDTATNRISGTSMASPHVAGAAALYVSTNTTATPPAGTRQPGEHLDAEQGDQPRHRGLPTGCSTSGRAPAHRDRHEPGQPDPDRRDAGQPADLRLVHRWRHAHLLRDRLAHGPEHLHQRTDLRNAEHRRQLHSTVTGRDSTSASGSATFGWTINGAGGGCTSPGQKLGNPGFESSTAAPWTASAGVIDSSTGQPARTGAKKAWLNGYGTSRTDTLSQT